MEENKENLENKEETNETSSEESKEEKQEEHKEYQEAEVKESPKEEQKKPRASFNFTPTYDRYYKILMIIPILMLVISLGYLYTFSQENGDIIRKDITLTGGTSIEVASDADIEELRVALESEFQEVSIRQVSDILTGEQVAFIIETSANQDEIIPFLENYLGFALNSENSSVEFTGSTLSDSFYNELRFAILFSFIIMAIVVFAIFRSFIPSLAVIFAAFADIVLSLALVNFLGFSLSTAGIVAFLMLIGYSVDTDILLTTRVLKRREGSVNTRIWGAFKTGMTMALTSLLVVLIGLVFTSQFSKIFSQIFTILTIGLIFDIINTWLFNASILKWYMERK